MKSRGAELKRAKTMVDKDRKGGTKGGRRTQREVPVAVALPLVPDGATLELHIGAHHLKLLAHQYARKSCSPGDPSRLRTRWCPFAGNPQWQAIPSVHFCQENRTPQRSPPANFSSCFPCVSWSANLPANPGALLPGKSKSPANPRALLPGKSNSQRILVAIGAFLPGNRAPPLDPLVPLPGNTAQQTHSARGTDLDPAHDAIILTCSDYCRFFLSHQVHQDAADERR